MTPSKSINDEMHQLDSTKLVAPLRSIELFAGAGGLGLGSQRAGFQPEVTVEWDRWACDTLRENRDSGHSLLAGWDIREADVRSVDWSAYEDIDLVSGGPPCQPFSISGRAQAADDPRDMFPATAEVIRQVRPRAFVFENVRGLTRLSFANYFEYIQLRLSFPQITRLERETWKEHLARLQREQTSAGSRGSDTYSIVANVVNAADYGVPQQRYRVFLVGFRDDIDARWSFPSSTHSVEALVNHQALGAYWDHHSIGTRKRVELANLVRSELTRQKADDEASALLPWRTVRDAIGDLPDPMRRTRPGIHNHVFQPGARTYRGHNGSSWDAPSKTIKAGGHGVPGGENMLRLSADEVRYFTVRESARLQTFPDDYRLHGSWGSAMRQLGNAVPVELGYIVAASVANHLR